MTRKHIQSLALALGLIAVIAAGSAGFQPAEGRQDGGAPSDPQKPADLVLRNGRVVTVDPARPEAQAVAFKADRIARRRKWS